MKLHTSWTLLLFACLAWSCGSESQTTEAGEAEAGPETAAEAPAETISVTPLEGSPAFAEASIGLGSHTANEDGTYTFNFDVEGYELGAQTEPKPGPLANSGKGQHIHLIVDNGPYSAHYEPTVSTDKLQEPGNHVVLAFLSRSYHESVKNVEGDKTSFFLSQYQTGEGEVEQADFTAPHMFYSRPKGTYKGEDTKKLLLDFFLLNTELSESGNKIRATINGQEFLLTEWRPYVIEGLNLGTVTIKLELMDGAGQPIPGPFNTVTREVTLAPADAE
ncbi:MAG: hypothetical protein AAFR61_02270 [Bacteroidota bacterium]